MWLDLRGKGGSGKASVKNKPEKGQIRETRNQGGADRATWVAIPFRKGEEKNAGMSRKTVVRKNPAGKQKRNREGES